MLLPRTVVRLVHRARMLAEQMQKQHSTAAHDEDSPDKDETVTKAAGTCLGVTGSFTVWALSSPRELSEEATAGCPSSEAVLLG